MGAAIVADEEPIGQRARYYVGRDRPAILADAPESEQNRRTTRASMRQYAPRLRSTADTVCASSLMSQLRLQPVTYM